MSTEFLTVIEIAVIKEKKAYRSGSGQTLTEVRGRNSSRKNLKFENFEY